MVIYNGSEEISEDRVNHITVVTSLPTTNIDPDIIYLTNNNDGSYNKNMYIDSTWVVIGTTVDSSTNIHDSDVLLTKTDTYQNTTTQAQYNDNLQNDLANLRSTKANKVDVDAKFADIDLAKLEALSGANYYDKSIVDQKLNLKVNNTTFSDLNRKVSVNENDITTLKNVIADKTDSKNIYDKATMDTLLEAKADDTDIASLRDKITSNSAMIQSINIDIAEKYRDALNTKIVVVETLPEMGDKNLLYLLKNPEAEFNYIYTYIKDTLQWEKVGFIKFDFSLLPSWTQVNEEFYTKSFVKTLVYNFINNWYRIPIMSLDDNGNLNVDYINPFDEKTPEQVITTINDITQSVDDVII